MKPFGITMGDSSGVGPEILLMAAARGELDAYPYVVYGDASVLDLCAQRLGIAVPSAMKVIDHKLLAADDLTPGEINAKSGAAARAYVVAAAEAALRGEIAGMVTLPMNKEATQLTDPAFTGHTELIGEVCGSSDVTIMLASPQLIVTHVSTHCSLRDAIDRCRKERVRTILELTWDAVRRIKGDAARIAVAGLNPHAGEHGLFGREEIDEIEPAIAEARANGCTNIDGPFPPDTLFYMAVQKKKFDAVVCMYHDQGHIPSKLLDFEGGVNVALGLPIIRTSVDHGTAFDIAWKGQASTRSLVQAFHFAAGLATKSRL